MCLITWQIDTRPSMNASHEDADRNETGRERFSLLLRGHVEGQQTRVDDKM